MALSSSTTTPSAFWYSFTRIAASWLAASEAWIAWSSRSRSFALPGTRRSRFGKSQPVYGGSTDYLRGAERTHARRRWKQGVRTR